MRGCHKATYTLGGGREGGKFVCLGETRPSVAACDTNGAVGESHRVDGERRLEGP
jgi:hypothetical protein